MNAIKVIAVTFYDQTTNATTDGSTLEQYECVITATKDGNQFVLNAHGNQFESNVIFNHDDADHAASSDFTYQNTANELFDLLGDQYGFENNFNWLNENANTVI